MSPHLVERLLTILVDADADMSCCRWRSVGASTAAESSPAHRTIHPGDVPGVRRGGAQLSDRVQRRAQTIASRRAPLLHAKPLLGQALPGIFVSRWSASHRRYAQDVAVAMDLYLRMRRVASCGDRLYYWLQRGRQRLPALRTASYYHDILAPHSRSFTAALDHGILPRAGILRTHHRAPSRAAECAHATDMQMYREDRALIRALKSRLTAWQRIRCETLSQLRRAEVVVYDRTVHRRR